MDKNTLMISPCGTSLLSNIAVNKERQLLFKYANAQKEEIPDQDIKVLSEVIQKAKEIVLKADFRQICSHSAELHAISRYYKLGQNTSDRDIHILLASDTWIGHETSKIVKSWLEQSFDDVRIEQRKDLATDKLDFFQSAMADLVKYFEDLIPPYRQNGYHIVFNLTGGFKSVQGFLQTLAMFYADEAVYIFQSQDELLRLPKLPVKLDARETIQSHLTLFRKLSRDLSVKKTEMEEIPETFYLNIGNEYCLSPWGELIWNQTKKEIYGEKVWDEPIAEIVFTDTFKKSVSKLSPDRLYNINERIDDLMFFICDEKNPNRLDFKELSGDPVPGSTHEFDAWADGAAKRVYCHIKNECVILDKLDKALH